MTRPRLLDLFCGAGGAAMGYHRAGFDVIGVDLNPQPNYPFEFVQRDAMQVLDFLADHAEPWPGAPGFDVIHASPPCHDHSALASATGNDHGTAWMLAATLDRLGQLNVPWTVENVANAKLAGSFRLVLCGSQFDLVAHCVDGVTRQLRRHRQFVSNVMLMQPECRHRGQPVGVYGDGGGRRGVIRANGTKRSVMATAAERREAMGIDWMTRAEIAQAIPPVFTQFIGEQLLEHLASVAA